MFGALFTALKRIFDFTLVPILLGVLAVAFEWVFGGISWVLIKILDVILRLLTGLINAIPFPAISLDDSTFGSGFMDIANVAGLWPALAIWLAGAVGAFLTRLFTLGIVGK